MDQKLANYKNRRQKSHGTFGRGGCIFVYELYTSKYTTNIFSNHFGDGAKLKRFFPGLPGGTLKKNKQTWTSLPDLKGGWET